MSVCIYPRKESCCLKQLGSGPELPATFASLCLVWSGAFYYLIDRGTIMCEVLDNPIVAYFLILGSVIIVAIICDAIKGHPPVKENDDA